MMKNFILFASVAFLTACSSTEVRDNSDLARLNLKGKVKTLTSFVMDQLDTSVVSRTVSTFDTLGRLLSHDEYRNEQLYARTLSSYDQEGRRTQDKYICYKDNGLSQTVEYRYDKAGQLIQKSMVSANRGSLRTLMDYDEQGRLIEEKHFDQSGGLHQSVSYRYNQQGQVTEKRAMRLEGSMAFVHQMSSPCPAYEQESSYQYIPGIYYKYTYAYDARGNPVSEKCQYADGSLFRQKEYRYMQTDMNQASFIEIKEERCDTFNDWQTVKCMNPRRIPKTPPYDVKGNWTRQTAVDKQGSILSVTARVIEYY